MAEAPAREGDALSAIDTPALLLELDLAQANMARVHERVLAQGLAVRAHVKAHKTPALARLQLAAGASGICCQKASEAEVFAKAGFKDILVTNQLVGEKKLARVAALAAGGARLGICVDHALQIAQARAAAEQAGSVLEVLVEVDIGHGRCGVADAAGALALARAIRGCQPWLRFGGLHAFRGSAQHMRLPQQRRAAVEAAVEKLREVLQVLRADGFDCPVVTGGGTGTYALEAQSNLYTEVQPGSYVLMDLDYAANQCEEGEAPLAHALTVLCTVISISPGRAVLDGGLKAFAVDQGLPRMLLPDWRVKTLSDEHAVIEPGPGAVPLAVGDKVQLIPGHCDPTVNLHDWMIAHLAGRVHQVWPVSARGALF
jgi:D-serine deaminase-like pyridoxal phosphate-dependent protein